MPLAKDGGLVRLLRVNGDLHRVHAFGQSLCDRERCQAMIRAVGVKSRYHNWRPIIHCDGQLAAVGTDQIVNPRRRAAELERDELAWRFGLPQLGKTIPEGSGQ